MNYYGYALSVVGIVILSVVAELMIPSGKTGKSAKVVFSLIVTLTLFVPIIKVVKGDYTFDVDYAKTSFYIDEDFCENVDRIAENDYNSRVYDVLKLNDISLVKSVDCSVDSQSKKLDRIKIIYDESGIFDEDEHTFINEVKLILSDEFNIGKEAVLVNGR